MWHFVAFFLFMSLLLMFRRTLRMKRERGLARSLGCLPPNDYPLLDPVFGLDFLYKSMKLIRQYQNIPAAVAYHQEYSKTFRVNSLGKEFFYSIDHENLQAVYNDKCIDWGVEPQRLKAMQPLCGVGYITSDGKSWKRSRTMLEPSLTASRIEDLTTFSLAVEKFLELLPTDGQTVDLSPALNELFLETGVAFLLGQNISTRSSQISMGNPNARDFLKALHASEFWAGMRVFFGCASFFGFVARAISSWMWQTHNQTVHRFVDHYIDMALQTQDQRQWSDLNVKNNGKGKRQQDLASSLIEQTKDRNEIRWQVIQGMIAMQDTTSTLISNTLFLLSRNRLMWARLRKETIHSSSNGITSATLGESRVVQNVLKESLRLYPVLVQYGRTALKDTTLPRGGGPSGSGSVFVAAGSTIVSSIYALHRQADVFGDDAESFNPDRWNHITPGPYEYLPFGNGPRRCAGQQKALVEASYLLARLALRVVRIESRDDRDWVGDWKLTVTNVNGCKVALKLD